MLEQYQLEQERGEDAEHDPAAEEEARQAVETEMHAEAAQGDADRRGDENPGGEEAQAGDFAGIEPPRAEGETDNGQARGGQADHRAGRAIQGDDVVGQMHWRSSWSGGDAGRMRGRASRLSGGSKPCAARRSASRRS
ncbi:MAG: hypothetical protein BWZ08_02283 [candidate division BRC1 bacterium ADurb.BinA292]|nr:MAG: hypothetical protein BWZ08_02283 [candidate division BRC1 bacterium ADurb.BinA292]